MISPFSPRPCVGFDIGVAEQFCGQVGEAGTVMSLAMGDNFLVSADAQRLQVLSKILAQTKAALRVHAGRPLKVDSSGNVPAFGRNHFLAAVFLRRSCIPNDPIRILQIVFNVLYIYRMVTIERDVRLAGGGMICLLLQRKPRLLPGFQATIDIAVVRVSYAVQ